MAVSCAVPTVAALVKVARATPAVVGAVSLSNRPRLAEKRTTVPSGTTLPSPSRTVAVTVVVLFPSAKIISGEEVRRRLARPEAKAGRRHHAARSAAKTRKGNERPKKVLRRVSFMAVMPIAKGEELDSGTKSRERNNAEVILKQPRQLRIKQIDDADYRCTRQVYGEVTVGGLGTGGIPVPVVPVVPVVVPPELELPLLP